MKDNTYWLHWKFERGSYWLFNWQDCELADTASKALWPCLTEMEAQGTVLAECHETKQTVKRDIANQALPHLNTGKLPFKNVHIVATPKHNDMTGDFIECVYTVERE